MEIHAMHQSNRAAWNEAAVRYEMDALQYAGIELRTHVRVFRKGQVRGEARKRNAA